MAFLEDLRFYTLNLESIAVIITHNIMDGLGVAEALAHTVVADSQDRPSYAVASMILGNDFCIYRITILYASKHWGEYLVMLKFAHTRRKGTEFFTHHRASI